MPFPRQAQGLRPHIYALPPSPVVFRLSSIRCASHSNKHKKLQSQAKARSDPFEAVLGKRQKPFWRSITPDFLRKETETSANKNAHYAQTSSFQMHASHKAGSKPVIEASSTTWDSKSNEVRRSVYDPISGRMIPAANTQSRQTSTSANVEGDKIPVKPYQKPTIVSQLPNDGTTLSNTPTTHASFTEDFDKSYPSEHEELLAARRHLETLREQVQILERQVHPEMTKPNEALDAERPAFFEDGWDSDPKGLQTAYEHEKEACEHGEMKPLEQELAALNKEPIQEINDGYSISPSGMQTLFAHEQEVDDIAHKSSLEQEMAAMNTCAPPLDDGYEASPKGLQTLFEQERYQAEHGERRSLEEEVRMAGSTRSQPVYDDGYATEPIGLQTLYDKELQGTPEQLEHELENLASDPTVRDPDDAYSNEPIGMQTLYEREEAEYQSGKRQDLEHELHDQLQARSPNDGFSVEPKGMQTLWEQEQENVESGSSKSLEEEIRARQQPISPSDGYSTTPIGMQTHFSKERQDIGAGRRETFEEEMSRSEQSQAYDDGYSRSPIGLQTAFDKEQKDAMLGRRQTLEREMNTREPSFEDGYSTMPMGLQMLFRRENHDAAQGNRRSLEEDIKKMEAASHHEDGYSRAPIGMQSSFDKETKAGSDSLEAELKSMPGEGDISPTVGKFATSDKWYKQPARSMFSEDIPKADVQEHNSDAPLAQDLQSKMSSGLADANPQLQTKTTTQAEVALPKDSSKSSLTNASTDTSSSKLNITWAEPPVYKAVAYDRSKDAISITTTSSNFSNGETPISIPYAIAQLEQAARFIPHLASLQNEGFQVIHASRDFLILRKVHRDSRSRSSRLGGAINPVDGTAKPPPIEPPTARFASPTGFVNHDPIFPPEPESVSKYEDSTGTVYDIPTHGRPESEQKSYYPSRGGRRDENNRRKDHYGGVRKERRGRWRRRTAWVLSVAAGTVACTYVAGLVNHASRPEKHVLRSSK